MKLIKDVLDVWAPDWPRRVTTHQQWVKDVDDASARLLAVEQINDVEPFISTYSFPNGHTSDGSIPKVNTLFIDFDTPNSSETSGEGWRREISKVLLRTRKVATALLENESSGWRASLSGNKGVHLFLDFPTVSPKNGDSDQFRAGLNSYAQQVEQALSAMADVDLSEYVDVTSADLARLCRVPNTLHGDATEFFEEPRYCVPVSIEELSNMHPDRYEELTQARRDLPQEYVDGRSPNQLAGRRVTQEIRASTGGVGKMGTTRSSRGSGSSSTDRALVREYKRKSNKKIELSDLPLIISDRPCVLAFRERSDMFERGNASRIMEISSILAMAEHQVPIRVMKEFFSASKRYSESQTESLIMDIISRMDEETLFSDKRVHPDDKNGMNQFNCERVWNEAPEYCLGDECGIFRHAEIESLKSK